VAAAVVVAAVVREAAEVALVVAGVLDQVEEEEEEEEDSAVEVAAVRDHRWEVRRRSVIRAAVALRDRQRRALDPARERDHDRALVAEMSAREIGQASERELEWDRVPRLCRAISRASVPARGLALDKESRIGLVQVRASQIAPVPAPVKGLRIDQALPSNRRGCRDSEVLLEQVLARGCRIREPIGRRRLKVGAAN
jgi:hypothetical protein